MKQSNLDIVKALTTIRSTGGYKDRSGIFSGLLMIVFLAMLMLALVIGVTAYQKIASAQFSSNEARLGNQLIANSVRSFDAVNAVKIEQGPEGSALVLVETVDSQNIETRIYLYKGQIVQEYTFEGSAFTPDKAVKLVDSSKFLLNLDSNLLTITTDQGVANVALRSGEGDR